MQFVFSVEKYSINVIMNLYCERSWKLCVFGLHLDFVWIAQIPTHPDDDGFSDKWVLHDAEWLRELKAAECI